MSTARGTDGKLLESLPWTLAALAVSIAPHLPYLPIWISVAFLACAAWRYTIELRRSPLPPGWVRGGLALAAFLGVLATYASISGVGPGSALLVVMAAAKLLETRQRRDQFVLLFISIFLLMSSLLREQYIWSVPYLAGGLLVILTAWLRMAASREQRAVDSLRTSGRLLLYAAPLAIAMWVFFPRLASPFWAVPIDTSQATTGISATMSPGDISSLSLSDAVAFRAQFDGEVPAPRDRYWRGLVLTDFNGRSWTPSGDPVVSRNARDDIETRGTAVSYTVTMEPTRQQWLFALEMPKHWDGIDNARMGPQQQLWRVTPIEQRLAYRVESYPDYAVRPRMTPLYRSWNTRLPESGNPEALALAATLRAAVDSDLDYVEAVLDRFNQQEFYYTLEPPPLGSNPVDRFLFDTRQGFCEHYASAFTFLMRAAGVPARVVVGYQGGEVNPIGGHVIVRQSDAHAWSEVFLDGRGWTRVDPTAAVAPERIEYGTRDPAYEGLAASWGFSPRSRFLHDLQMSWDALNAKWNEWILGYGPDKQNEFMRRLGLDDPDWQKMLLLLVGCVIVLVTLVSGLLIWRNRPPSKDPAARLYATFVRRSGIESRVGETPLAFAERATAAGRLSPAAVQAMTAAYLDYRYGSGETASLDALRTTLAAARPRRRAA